MRMSHTTLDFLPNRGFPIGTTNIQFFMCIVTGSTGPSRNCAFAHMFMIPQTDVFRKGTGNNGCQPESERRSCRGSPIPPLPKVNGFLGGFL